MQVLCRARVRGDAVPRTLAVDVITQMAVQLPKMPSLRPHTRELVMFP